MNSQRFRMMERWPDYAEKFAVIVEE